MSAKGIYVPAIGRGVTITAYVAAIHKAKANPTAEFPHGLGNPWRCTGADIVREYRQALHKRISSRRPVSDLGGES